MMPNTSDGKLNLRAVIFSILIIICASAFCGCVCAYDGIGTESNPYQIQTASDLKQLAEDVNNGKEYSGKFFKVTSDIDLSGVEWIPIGRHISPYNTAFMGCFDGDGHTISNLYINNPNDSYLGLFGYVRDADIKNINLTDISITGNNYIGGAAGYYSGLNGTHVIENCNASGMVSGKDNVGGLVGYNYIIGYGNAVTLTIKDSHFCGTAAGSNYVGGAAGYNYVTGNCSALTISDSYFSGNVISSGDYCAGGIAGAYKAEKYGKAAIENCNASGTVSGSYYAGGIVGNIYVLSGGSAYVKSCAALNRYVSGEADVGRVVGKIHLHNNSTAELMNNYGWAGMKNNVTGKLFTDNIGRNKINGENLVLTSKMDQTQSHMPIVGLLIGLAAAAQLFRRR